jgi:hypothetical protein
MPILGTQVTTPISSRTMIGNGVSFRRMDVRICIRRTSYPMEGYGRLRCWPRGSFIKYA